MPSYNYCDVQGTDWFLNLWIHLHYVKGRNVDSDVQSFTPCNYFGYRYYKEMSTYHINSYVKFLLTAALRQYTILRCELEMVTTLVWYHKTI